MTSSLDGEIEEKEAGEAVKLSTTTNNHHNHVDMEVEEEQYQQDNDGHHDDPDGDDEEVAYYVDEDGNQFHPSEIEAYNAAEEGGGRDQDDHEQQNTNAITEAQQQPYLSEHEASVQHEIGDGMNGDALPMSNTHTPLLASARSPEELSHVPDVNYSEQDYDNNNQEKHLSKKKEGKRRANDIDEDGVEDEERDDDPNQEEEQDGNHDIYARPFVPPSSNRYCENIHEDDYGYDEEDEDEDRDLDLEHNKGPALPDYAVAFELTGHRKNVSCIRFSPSGEWLITAGGDGRILLYSIGHPAPRNNSSNSTTSIPPPTPKPVFVRSYTIPSPSKVILKEGQNSALVPPGGSPGINDLVFTPDSKYFATASDDKIVRIWKIDKFPKNNNILDPSMDPIVLQEHQNANNAAAAAENGTAGVEAAGTGKGNGTVLGEGIEHEEGTRNEDGMDVETLLVGETMPADEKDIIQDATAGQGQSNGSQHPHQQQLLQGNGAAGTSRSTGNASTSNITNTSNSTTYNNGNHNSNNNTDSRPNTTNGRTDIIIPSSAMSKAADTPIELHGHTSFVFCVAFTPQGNLLASGSYDETVRIWDVKRGRCLRTLPAHADPVAAVGFSGDGSIFCSAGHDGLLRLWDTSTGQCLKSLVDESNPPASHAIFTPNSRYILVSSLDSTIRLWDYHAAVCMKTYTGHKNVKYHIPAIFSLPPKDKPGGGTYIITGSEDGKIVFFDLQSRNIAFTLEGHKDIEAPILCLALDPHSGMLATAAVERGVQEHTVKLWMDRNRIPKAKPRVNGRSDSVHLANGRE